MDSAIWAIAPWHNRIGRTLPSKPSPISPEDLDKLPEHWRKRWLQAIGPDEPYKLARRLNWDGIELEALQDWLSGRPADMHIKQASEELWKHANAALTELQAVLRESLLTPLLPYGTTDALPFIDLWNPMQHWGITQLQQHLDSLCKKDLVSDGALQDLASGLVERLCATSDQVLWYVYSQGRGAGTMLMAHLGQAGHPKANPPREHYEDFIQRHRRDGLTSLLGTYPILGRHLGSVVHFWRESSFEMLTRVCNDRKVLAQKFAITKFSKLVRIGQGLSDPHRGGRTASVLYFSQSCDNASAATKVVYKPKDMSIDVAYQSALEDLNFNSDLPPFRVLSIHNSSSYGYMEYVEHELCADEKQLQLFYRQAGRLAAVLHMLGCTDCHHENLIASGHDLVLIDTETLFEPDFSDAISSLENQASVFSSRLHRKFLSLIHI